MFLFFITLVFSVLAIAQEVIAEMPLDAFLAQVFNAVESFGGLSWGLKVGAVIAILISSMKVSLLRKWTWDKLPEWSKHIAAPLLALLAGLVSLGKWDAPALIAWVMAGGGAILLDNFLSGVKAMPGIGPKYLMFIEMVSKLLKKPSA
jgi:hypothetical protein